MSYFTHMLLRITDLKALVESEWRPQRRANTVRNAMIPDEKKHQDDESRRKTFSDQRKRIYLVNNIFEAWKNAKIEAGYKRCSEVILLRIHCL